VPAIIIPRRHLVQPQGRVQVSREWEDLGLLLGFGQGRPIDYAGQASASLVGAASVRASPSGLALSNSTGNTVSHALLTDVLPGYSGSFTFLCFLPEIAATQSDFGYVLLEVVGDKTVQVAGSTFYWYNQTTVALGETTLGTRNRTMVMRVGTDPSVFLDRTKYTLPGATGFSSSTVKTLRIGGHSIGSQASFVGQVGVAAIVPSSISDSRILQFQENPWQLFRADPLRIYSFPSGAITLNSLTMSNFTSSGARAILSVTR
jgi:hypothetical protein